MVVVAIVVVVVDDDAVIDGHRNTREAPCRMALNVAVRRKANICPERWGTRSRRIKVQ